MFAETEIPEYVYYENKNGIWVSTPDFISKNAIAKEAWDIITIQQASFDSGKIDTYNDEDIDFLIEYIKQHCTNKDVKIAWHMTWAYQSDSEHWAFPDYESNQMTMYKAITDAVFAKIITRDDIDFVIPAGTAIQNARGTSLGDNMTADGYHLNELGQYIAGLMWLKSITGWDLSATIYVPQMLKSIIRNNRDNIYSSVNNAYANPYKTQSD